ncbi:uncharacterized protein LOC131679911 [Topomyia yanbarensis]|uniref:uncharacterized protein LOC131679911 n=1 Tax=Topomyia yanbarensis TaxID=2498891 RepID=UPI00273C9FFA|nr:uncharacterized protein LOC131679911 [Topomyia yanbarensis]
MVPRRDVKLARYEFAQCRQEPANENGESESMTNCINKARGLAKECNFGNLEDEMLRDKIITGLLDINLKKQFLKQQNLTSEMVISQCQMEEATQVDLVRNNWLQPGPSAQTINKLTGSKQVSTRKCSFCGRGYHKKLSECPARGATCNHCKQKNHYAAVCR